jgi:DNA-binding transcriptional LysR family regulator
MRLHRPAEGRHAPYEDAPIARLGGDREGLKAARAMNLSQPAPSKSIRELERQLGVPLLVRGATGATLTPFGAILSKRYEVMQKELDKAREEIDWLKGTLGGRLLVAMSPPAAGAGLASVFASFRQRQPSVELELLELRPAQIFDAVRSGVIDLGIVHHYGETDLAGLQCVTLKSYQTILAIGGHDPALPQSIERLWDREWITSDLAEHADGYISVLASRLGIDPPSRLFRCTSIAVYFELAEQPQLVSHWADNINPYLDMKFGSGALTKLNLGMDLPAMDIALVYKDDELLSPGGALLTKIIRSAFNL